jgi:hypothetical protein
MAGPGRAAAVLAGTACLALVAGPAAEAAKPKLGRTAVVQRAKGTVLVKKRSDRRFERLRGTRVIPLGSTVDTTRGRVRLTTAANRSGGTHSGVLSQGPFVVTQTRGREPVTELRLAGPVSGCEQAARGGARPAQRRISRLRGTTRGRHRSRGNHSSANIYGTTWISEDRCDGTQHTAVDGEVEVTDGEATFKLPEGYVALWYCEPVGAQPLDRSFCLIELGNGDLWGLAIAARTDLTDYQVCILNPAGDVVCRNFQFDSSSLDERGAEVRYGDVFCLAGDGPGIYFAAWGFNNEAIGVALPFIVTEPPREGICPFDQEEVGLPESGVSRSAFRAVLRRVPTVRGRTFEGIPGGRGSLPGAVRARLAGIR